MAVPSITLLPDPPLPTDPEAVFDAKAGASLTAQQAMVPQINTSLTWIGAQVTAVDGYRQAAATSATNSANSATAANTSKNAAAQSAIDATNNGAAQVVLAAAQVTLAQQAANAAQSAAQAAGAAAGLPGGRVPYTVLQISAAGSVSWGDGLIDKTAAVPGQALMLGTGKAPKWDFPGQQIGDVLISARNPGALYLPANGGIRLKSAFPQLAALVGAINGVIGTTWANVAVASTVATVAASTSGTVIYSGTGVVYRSTDRGQTFGSAISLPIAAALSSLDTDGNGNWVGLSSANTSATQIAVYSNDDGLTWTQVSLPALTAGYAWNAVRYAGGNSWVVINRNGAATTILRSTDAGKTWASISHGMTQVSSIGIAGTGTVVFGGALSSAIRVSRSADFGASFTVGATLPGSTALAIDTDRAGTWYIGCSASANGNVFRSLDDGLTFSALPVFGSGSGSNVNRLLWLPDKILFATSGSPNGMSAYSLATQVLTTVASGSIVGNGSTLDRIADAGLGVLVSISATANNIARATPQFPYDTGTQFALPAVSAPAGTAAYIKAKELA
jgi:hypothetical protein